MLCHLARDKGILDWRQLEILALSELTKQLPPGAYALRFQGEGQGAEPHSEIPKQVWKRGHIEARLVKLSREPTPQIPERDLTSHSNPKAQEKRPSKTRVTRQMRKTYRRRRRLRRYLSQHDKQPPPPPTRERGTEGSGEQQMIAMWNVGGWPANQAQILSVMKGLDDTQRPTLLFLQETHLRKGQQNSVGHMLQQEGWQGFWGQAAKHTRVGPRMRVDVGACPGVACIAPKEAQVYQVAPATPQGQKCYDQGRLQILQVGPLPNPDIYYNVYAPSGSGQEQARAEFWENVYTEVAAHGSRKCCVVGDMNQAPHTTGLAAQTLPRGWRIPVLYEDGETPQNRASGTHQGLRNVTWIDGFLLGPDYQAQVNVQQTRWIAGHRHAMVYLKVPQVPVVDWPRIFPPPTLEPLTGWKAMMMQHWSSLREANQALYRQAWAHAWDLQGQVDGRWEQLKHEYREELTQRQRVTRGNMRDLGETRLDWRPKKSSRASPKGPMSARSACLHAHVQRLQTLAQGPNTKAQQRLEQDQPRICEALALSPAQFRKALQEPAHHITFMAHESERVY